MVGRWFLVLMNEGSLFVVRDNKSKEKKKLQL